MERWRPGDDEPEILVDSLTWAPGAEAAALAVDLSGLFRRVYGEAMGVGE